jgi:anti-sigma-K factor RskA
VNSRGKPELQERLAAEYALGTLRGAARRRFERWMEEDAATAQAASRWQARLTPMSGAVAPVVPPARVWRAIRERLGEPARAPGLWASVAFWRALGLAASSAAAALLAVVLFVAPAGEPAATHVAVLSDAKSQKAVLLVSAAAAQDRLRVRTLDPAIHVEGKSLELWALPAGGAPKSLGVVPADARAMLRLAAPVGTSLAGVPALAVTLEPRGGSPSGAPTGPVLFSGPWLPIGS